MIIFIELGEQEEFDKKIKQLPLLMKVKLRFLDSQNQRVPNCLRELSKSNGNYMKKSFIEKKKNNSINNEFSSEINWRDD